MRLTRLLLNLFQDVQHYSHFMPTALSMQQLIDFGAKHRPPQDSFHFLQKELPVRMANIMREMSLLPDVLTNTESVNQIKDWYELSFKELLDFTDADSNKPKVLERFLTALNNVKNRHSTVVETMAEGVREMRMKLLHTPITELDIKNANPSEMLKSTGIYSSSLSFDETVQYFLDRFYMSRISINMLIETHLSLFSRKYLIDEEYDSSKLEDSELGSDKEVHHLIGCLDPHCDVTLLARNAFEDAKDLCEKHFGFSTDCQFAQYNNSIKGQKVKMTYVPSHLYHILFELFKNAQKATLDRYTGSTKLPLLHCLISRAEEDIIIKISDRGRGIARSNLTHIFRYQCSSSPAPPPPDDETLTVSPLSGYGYGLPLSRLYARYFSGDLWLNSIEGFGTDAMVALKANPSEATEVLPLMNKTTSSHYSSHVQVNDWSDSKYIRKQYVNQNNNSNNNNDDDGDDGGGGDDEDGGKSGSSNDDGDRNARQKKKLGSLSKLHE